MVEHVVAEVDRACSRFRDDSDLDRGQRGPGHRRPGVAVAARRDRSRAARRARDRRARRSHGRQRNSERSATTATSRSSNLTVRRFASACARFPVGTHPRRPRAGDGARPDGREIDLGATAKAWCADRAANAAAAAVRNGVIVGLGGDLACAGDAPDGGWRVRVADDHRAAVDEPGGQTVDDRERRDRDVRHVGAAVESRRRARCTTSSTRQRASRRATAGGR